MLKSKTIASGVASRVSPPTVTRESWIDWIRVLGTFGIVVLHVTAREKVRRAGDLTDFDWWTLAVYEAITRIAVPLFFMISGYLIMSRCADGNNAPYAFRRTARTYAVALFWTLVFSCWEIVKENNDSILGFFPKTFLGQPYYHLWFLYAIAGTYFAAPFLGPGLCALRANYGRLIAWGLPLAFSVEFVISELRGPEPLYRTSILSIGIPYLAYTCAGYLLAPGTTSYSQKTSIALYLSGFTAALVLYANLSTTGFRLPDRMPFNPLAPTVVIMTLGAYLIVSNSRRLAQLRLPRLGHRFAQDSMGIYILHPFVLDFVYHYRLMAQMPGALIGIAAASVLVTVITWAAVVLYKKIWFLKATITL